jgi:rhodanese-related sulfurtransferase
VLKTAPGVLSVLAKDFLLCVGLAIVALVLGLMFNRFRAAPLPARYVPKEVRLQSVVAALNGAATKPAEIRYVLLDEFSEMLARTPPLVLDARPEELYQRGHIPGALPLPPETFQKFYEQHRTRLEVDKAQALVVYCQGAECEDSELVAKALTELGFRNVSILAGGWDGWQARTGQ